MAVISGKIDTYFWLPNNTNNVYKRILNIDDVIIIKPGLVHAFNALTYTQMLETSPTEFDIKDTFYSNKPAEELLAVTI